MYFVFDPPADFSELLIATFDCYGKQSARYSELRYFLSFRKKWFKPSEAGDQLDRAIAEGYIQEDHGILTLSPKLQQIQWERERASRERIRKVVEAKKVVVDATQKKGFNDYFRAILLPDAIFKVATTRVDAIQLSKNDPASEIVEAKIFASDYDINMVTIDGKIERITHSCDQFPEKATKDGKFCHHVGALFKKLQKENPDFALSLIHKLAIRQPLWHYEIV